MTILDSDIVIWILRGKQELVEYVASLREKEECAVSTITIAEIYKNVKATEVTFAEDFFSKQEIFSVTDDIARAGGLYWRDYVQKTATIGITDCLIAATAKMHKATLVTLNTRHFPMRDVTVVNPLKS